MTRPFLPLIWAVSLLAMVLPMSAALSQTAAPAAQKPEPMTGAPPAGLAGRWSGAGYGFQETIELDGLGHFRLTGVRPNGDTFSAFGTYAIDGERLILAIVGRAQPVAFPLLAAGAEGFAIRGPLGRFDYKLQGPPAPDLAQTVAVGRALEQTRTWLREQQTFTAEMSRLTTEHQIQMQALDMQRAASQASFDMIDEMIRNMNYTHMWTYE